MTTLNEPMPAGGEAVPGGPVLVCMNEHPAAAEK
jgi:hypothetical protein